MNKTAIALMTKDRLELTEQTVRPLQQDDKFDLWWFDGSETTPAVELALSQGCVGRTHFNIRGGPDAAVVCALSTMLAARTPGLDSKPSYDYIGIVENDVLLPRDWFGPTMALFKRGEAEGLEVGAVSARAYEDRVLCQRDGYAIMHNLGYGMVIMTREAVRIFLNHVRTSITSENRRTFALLSGLDIGRWWAFRESEHWLTADWGLDRILSAHGLASLALTPSLAEMIGQVPPLHEQGLNMVWRSVDLLRNEHAFRTFAERTERIRGGDWVLPPSRICREHDSFIYFAHQIHQLGDYRGEWRLKWSQGFGPFGWQAGTDGDPPTIELFVQGAAALMVGGGKSGSELRVEWSETVFKPLLLPGDNVLQIELPDTMDYRAIKVTATKPGAVFYGIRTKQPQPGHFVPFGHAMLPPPGDPGRPPPA